MTESWKGLISLCSSKTSEICINWKSWICLPCLVLRFTVWIMCPPLLNSFKKIVIYLNKLFIICSSWFCYNITIHDSWIMTFFSSSSDFSPLFLMKIKFPTSYSSDKEARSISYWSHSYTQYILVNMLSFILPIIV